MTLKRKYDKLPKYCQFENNIKLLKNKWTVYIIRDMILGKKYFTEFQEDKPELSNKVLSQRLKELEHQKIIRKEISEDESSYYLTDKGKRLQNIIYELAVFNIEDAGYSPEELKKIKKELKKLKGETPILYDN